MQNFCHHMNIPLLVLHHFKYCIYNKKSAKVANWNYAITNLHLTLWLKWLISDLIPKKYFLKIRKVRVLENFHGHILSVKNWPLMEILKFNADFDKKKVFKIFYFSSRYSTLKFGITVSNFSRIAWAKNYKVSFFWVSFWRTKTW